MILKRNFLNSRSSCNFLQLIIIPITHKILKIILQLLNLILFKLLITHLAIAIIAFVEPNISLIYSIVLMSFWRIIHSFYFIKGQLANILVVHLGFTLDAWIILRWTRLNFGQFIDALWSRTHFNLIVSFF